MAKDLIPYQVITLAAVIGGLISIYLTNLPIVGEIFSIIATALAIVFGTNTLRHIGNYSLGTGVPSIVYMLTALGLVSVISGILLSLTFNQYLLYPVISIIVAFAGALLISFICTHVFKIEVEILGRSFISIAIATVLSIIGMSTLIATSFDVILVYNSVIKTGLVVVLMILTVMAMQNPYNSCMGPNEDQYRTLALSLSNAFLMLMVVSIVSLTNNNYWHVPLSVSAVCWAISISKYFKYAKQQAASVRWSGLWPQDDKDEL